MEQRPYPYEVHPLLVLDASDAIFKAGVLNVNIGMILWIFSKQESFLPWAQRGTGLISRSLTDQRDR